jgi:hypothetical protein
MQGRSWVGRLCFIPRSSVFYQTGSRRAVGAELALGVLANGGEPHIARLTEMRVVTHHTIAAAVGAVAAEALCIDHLSTTQCPFVDHGSR